MSGMVGAFILVALLLGLVGELYGRVADWWITRGRK